MIELVERLRSCLLRLEVAVGGPRLDVEWLRLRCDDTRRFAGELQRDSLRELQKDVLRFVEEFPDVIPSGLVEEVLRWTYDVLCVAPAAEGGSVRAPIGSGIYG